MNAENTALFLDDVWVGRTDLRNLVGRKFEGHFGEFHLAGVITDLRKQDNGILINWRVDSPIIKYVDGVGVQYYFNMKEIFVSSDFIID